MSSSIQSQRPVGATIAPNASLTDVIGFLGDRRMKDLSEANQEVIKNICLNSQPALEKMQQGALSRIAQLRGSAHFEYTKGEEYVKAYQDLQHSQKLLSVAGSTMYAKTGIFSKVKAFFSNWREFGLKHAVSSKYVPEELVVTPSDIHEETKKVFLQLLENNHKNIPILGESYSQVERSEILKGKHWVKLINHPDLKWKSLSEVRSPEWMRVAAIVNGPKKLKFNDL